MSFFFCNTDYVGRVDRDSQLKPANGSLVACQALSFFFLNTGGALLFAREREVKKQSTFTHTQKKKKAQTQKQARAAN